MLQSTGLDLTQTVLSRYVCLGNSAGENYRIPLHKPFRLGRPTPLGNPPETITSFYAVYDLIGDCEIARRRYWFYEYAGIESR
jgi:hypothetical protein